MPSYMLRGLPAGLVARAKERARADDTTLDAVLMRYLLTYAEQGATGSAGGRARAARLTPAERRGIAQRAARVRWQHRESE